MANIVIDGKRYKATISSDIKPKAFRYCIFFDGTWYEPIEEKPNDWEILSLKSPMGDIPVCHTKLIKLFIEGNLKGYSILSAKRLSDGEVFTVGDKVKYVGDCRYSHFVIDNFFLKEGGQLLLRSKGDALCEFIQEVKKFNPALFITNDGVLIYEGDEYPAVQKKTFDIIQKCKGRLTYPDQWVTFSTIEAANEWKLFNKPTLSLNDLLNVWDKNSPYAPDYFKDAPLFLSFKEAAKQKLKQ
jgi:hypothetical protein